MNHAAFERLRKARSQLKTSGRSSTLRCCARPVRSYQDRHSTIRPKRNSPPSSATSSTSWRATNESKPIQTTTRTSNFDPPNAPFQRSSNSPPNGMPTPFQRYVRTLPHTPSSVGTRWNAPLEGGASTPNGAVRSRFGLVFFPLATPLPYTTRQYIVRYICKSQANTKRIIV